MVELLKSNAYNEFFSQVTMPSVTLGITAQNKLMDT